MRNFPSQSLKTLLLAGKSYRYPAEVLPIIRVSLSMLTPLSDEPEMPGGLEDCVQQAQLPHEMGNAQRFLG
jgi:hypothetical protein